VALGFTVLHTLPGNSNQAQNAIDLVITLDLVVPNALCLQALCTFTLLCRDGDSHFSDAGYQSFGGADFRLLRVLRLQSRRRSALPSKLNPRSDRKTTGWQFARWNQRLTRHDQRVAQFGKVRPFLAAIRARQFCLLVEKRGFGSIGIHRAYPNRSYLEVVLPGSTVSSLVDEIRLKESAGHMDRSRGI
jgi:hypothetical protein